MTKLPKECSDRLAVGFVLNIGLWFALPEMSKWSSLEREIRANLIGVSLAAMTLVFVIPVFWRGLPWQAPLAFVLIFFLPGLTMFSVITSIVSNW